MISELPKRPELVPSHCLAIVTDASVFDRKGPSLRNRVATTRPLVPELRLGNAHSGSSASGTPHSTDTRDQYLEPKWYPDVSTGHRSRDSGTVVPS